MAETAGAKATKAPAAAVQDAFMAATTTVEITVTITKHYQ